MLFTKPGSRWIWSEGMIGNDCPRPYRGRGKENALWIPGRFLYILGRFAFSLCCGLNCLPSQFVCWSPISWYLRMWLYLKIRHVLNSSIDFFLWGRIFYFDSVNYIRHFCMLSYTLKIFEYIVAQWKTIRCFLLVFFMLSYFAHLNFDLFAINPHVQYNLWKQLFFPQTAI